MNGKTSPVSGVLARDGQNVFLKGNDGTRFFFDCAIWNGYLLHWEGKRLCGRALPEHDYITGRPLALLWPDVPATGEPFVELYYNERLVRYLMSFLGHIAINVNGEIFNFSHLLNECEVMSPAEYFYRPALGPFSPAPGGGFDTSNPGRPYLDKFGRNFMRTIHVLRVTGRDTDSLARYLHHELRAIHDTPVDPRRPDKYADFGVISRNCSTIIRDALRDWGFASIKGILPRDMFTCAAWAFHREARHGRISLTSYTMPQLQVPEAPSSAMTPLVNPVNRLKISLLKKAGIQL